MKKIIILISLCACLLFLISCTGRQTVLEKNRGRALETAKYKHTVNPDARSTETMEGTHGLVGAAAMKSYHESFGQQKREEIVNIINLR
jgi:hypothetical protein